jgi:hypothetical protein
VAQNRDIERLRSLIYNLRDQQGTWGNPEMDSCVDRLVQEFDIAFPYQVSRALERRVSNIKELIRKYCYKDKTQCPMCGSPMILRKNSKTGGTFYGCSNYPECVGSRDKDGNITITKDLQLYLMQMEESNLPVVNDVSRFDKIDED